jgi:multicomponent Na+:H+ antiporter subunit E
MTFVKNITSKLKFFIFILILWFLFNFNFELRTIVFGVVISIFVSLFTYEVLYDEHGFKFKGVRLGKLFLYFFILFFEIFKSSFLYVINLFKRNYEPVVFKITLDHLTPIQVAIVANSITLTPGTISIEVINKTIFVMVLADPNTNHQTLAKPIKDRFEKFLLEKEDYHGTN